MGRGTVNNEYKICTILNRVSVLDKTGSGVSLMYYLELKLELLGMGFRVQERQGRTRDE